MIQNKNKNFLRKSDYICVLFLLIMDNDMLLSMMVAGGVYTNYIGSIHLFLFVELKDFRHLISIWLGLASSYLKPSYSDGL